MTNKFERLERLILERKLIKENFPELAELQTDTAYGARQTLLDYYDELLDEEIFYLQTEVGDDDGD